MTTIVNSLKEPKIERSGLKDAFAFLRQKVASEDSMPTDACRLRL
jgi:hypothetical protein